MSDTYSLIRRLMLAGTRMDGAYYYFARKSGIPENLLALLYALDDEKPHSQREICEDWLIPKTTVNTLVRELVAQGHATLLPSHGREKTIELTPSGRAYAQKALQVVYEAEKAAMERTLAVCSPEFVDAMELFSKHICEEYKSHLSIEG